MSVDRHYFRLEVERESAALERVLGVVRRRGLALIGLFVVPDGARAWDVSIVAGAPAAEADLALRQFAALVDVRRARIEDQPPV